MARLPGLFQRGVVYQLRVMVPLDLRPLYAGRSKLVRSLGTADWREAERLGAQVRAELLEDFAERRRALQAQALVDLPPSLGPALAERLQRRLLRWDAQMRADPALADAWLRFVDAFGFTTLTRLGQGPPAVPALPSADELARLAPHSPFDGLTAAQLARLAELNSATDETRAQALAPRSLAALTTIADSEARRLGLVVDWQQAAARPLLLDCLRAWRAAHAEIVGRGDGDPTPPAAARSARPAPPRLREVFVQWQQAKPRSEDTVQACERALALFEQLLGDPPVQALTRTHGEAFRRALLALGGSTKTAGDRLGWIKALLAHAQRALGLIPRQPWAGVVIGPHGTAPNRPWSDGELRTLLSLPLFVRHQWPPAPHAGGEAAFWLPLLALYTGARLGELCRLAVADVDTAPAGSFLRLGRPGARPRRVPVHAELVRLGLLEHVAALRRAGTAALWPRLPLRRGRPGAHFSDWFNAWHRTTTTNPQAPGFDGLRETVHRALRSAGVEPGTVGLLLGGGEGGRLGAVRAGDPNDMELQAAIAALRFPTPGLRRIPPIKPA